MGHIHAPQPDDVFIKRDIYPDCKKRVYFVSWYTPWHGSDATCLNCSRNWKDNEWQPLAFVRGSRAKSIAYAKETYRQIKKGLKCNKN